MIPSKDLGPRPAAASCQRSSDTASSSPESGGANGDAKRNGKSRRRKKRASNLDGGAATEDEARGDAVRPGTRREAAASLAGLRSECATVWLERSRYERAESLYHAWLASGSPPAPGKCSAHPLVKESDPLRSAQPPPPDAPSLRTFQAPDPGHRPLSPSPAAAAPRHSVNGLPGVPLQLLQGVWLDKPQYDRAEAAFYQNLYGSNSSKRPGAAAAAASRGAERPLGLAEEEEEEEEEEEPAAPQGKAEVFHALHPIQEEEEPAEDPSGSTCFLHPDSRPVWTDRGQFHHRGGKKGRRSGGAAANQLGVKYGGADSPRLHCLFVVALISSPHALTMTQRSWFDLSPPPALVSGAGGGCRARGLHRRLPALLRSTMASVGFLALERIWLDKPRYDEAERRFYERRSRGPPPPPAQDVGSTSILQDIARARENIQKSLAGNPSPACSPADQELVSRIKKLELENQHLYQVMDDLRASLSRLESRVAVLETPAATTALTNGTSAQKKANTPSKTEDDDLDLFGSEEEDEEAEKLREQRVKEYAAKKSQKPALVAKSSILLDVKPWDDETDMRRLEASVRSLQMDGLLWGGSRLLPVGYGIHKLQIGCVVEDDKVGTELLEEEILKFHLYVQSVDVAAFNKI